MSRAEILLETGTNELEILELFITHKGSGAAGPEPGYFGINVAKVMQVIESPKLSPPESASHPSFRGTISLRNRLIPVLDLSTLLHIDRQQAPYEIVIITEFSQAVSGLLVSGVTDIFRVGWGEVMPPSGYLENMVTGCLIGIIEKHDHFIQLLKKVLSEANFSLQIVNNGAEAHKYLMHLKDRLESGQEKLEDALDIVIADIEMPLMDGFSLTKKIKEDPVLQALPVILYSSLITKELRHKGEAVRADEQLSKPELPRMAERAIQLIENRRQ